VAGSEFLVQRIDEAAWASLAQTFVRRNYQQGASYAQRAAIDVRAKSEIVAIYRDRELVGLASARIRPLPVLPFRIVYVVGGPVYQRFDATNSEAFAHCATALANHFVTRPGIVLRIAPASNSADESDMQAAVLAKQGFVPSSARAYRTLMKRIDEGDVELRKSFDSRWRRNLVRSEAEALTVTRSSDVQSLIQLERIHQDLMQTKAFRTKRDTNFFADVQANASEIERLTVHLAWSGDDLIGGHVGCMMGDTAMYLIGAASEKGRASRAGYRLHWEFMRYARDAGAVWYDLCGIDPDGAPELYRFKKYLNGVDTTWAGSFDYARDRFSLRAMRLFDRYR